MGEHHDELLLPGRPVTVEVELAALGGLLVLAVQETLLQEGDQVRGAVGDQRDDPGGAGRAGFEGVRQPFHPLPFGTVGQVDGYRHIVGCVQHGDLAQQGTGQPGGTRRGAQDADHPHRADVRHDGLAVEPPVPCDQPPGGAQRLPVVLPQRVQPLRQLDRGGQLRPAQSDPDV